MQERLKKEVLSSPLFDTVRKEKEDFDRWAEEKIHCLPGDITVGAYAHPFVLCLCNMVVGLRFYWLYRRTILASPRRNLRLCGTN
jgi:hypothetical protein